MNGFDPNALADRLEAVPASLGLEAKRAIVVEVVDALLAHAKVYEEQEDRTAESAEQRDLNV